MARGWESKAVESQQDSMERAKAPRIDQRTPEEIAKNSKLNSLMLSRTRVLHDIETAHNARYRLQLEQALAHLDSQIAAIADPAVSPPPLHSSGI
jgi:hypothetical protein